MDSLLLDHQGSLEDLILHYSLLYSLRSHCNEKPAVSFLLGPGVHKVLFVPSKSLFPQSCLSSGSSMVGLMVTSSKRAYAIGETMETVTDFILGGSKIISGSDCRHEIKRCLLLGRKAMTNLAY